MKTCAGPCKETKSLPEFRKVKRNKDGRGNICKACINAKGREETRKRQLARMTVTEEMVIRGKELENVYRILKAWEGFKREQIQDLSKDDILDIFACAESTISRARQVLDEYSKRCSLFQPSYKELLGKINTGKSYD